MIRRGPTRLGDHRLALREVGPADAERLFLWRTQPRARDLFHTPGPASREEHGAFLARYLDPANDDCWFVIEADARPVGSIALYRRPTAPAEWEVGRFVFDPALRGLGTYRLARQAGILILEFARRAGHRTMFCEILAANRVMLSIVASLGFVVRDRAQRCGRDYLELEADLAAGADRERGAPGA